MNQNKLTELLRRYHDGSITSEEFEELEEWFHSLNYAHPDKVQDQSEEALKHRLFASFNEKLVQQDKTKRRTLYTKISIAATLLIVLSAGLFFYQKQKVIPRTAQLKQSKSGPIIPGSSKAILTLANGKTIDLQTHKDGVLSKSDDIEIQKNGNLLAYSSASSQGASSQPDSNILTVPRGGIFRTVLSDGTKVWMNSASSLRYPVSFSGKVREVVLSGEAYFEVAKNKSKPFRVMVNGVEIKVLGTHFNVRGYEEDQEVSTTLLEGSVQLHTPVKSSLLVPGERGVFRQNNADLTISKVNTEDEVAWKEGYFVFDNLSLSHIMQNISRWYDVDVVFQGKVKDAKFGGTISRQRDIAVILKGLETTGSVRFKIEGRRVIVLN